ncbi:MAG TPA: hypothetical protein VGF69_04535 [Thermoanaerobaculia bacterium]|jgi:hypothetical protein
MRRSLLLLMLAVLLTSCDGSSPTDPEDRRPRGRLAGAVKIGPNCPNENPDRPCPTSSTAYAQRKVLVYDEARTRILFTVDIDSAGVYLIDLLPGRYTVDIRGVGVDRSADVPKVVEITPFTVTRLDIAIDTGLR